jgi:peptidyl-prolyl cis-trans isomerase C
MNRILGIAALVSLVALASACSRTSGRTVAMVDGQRISAQELVAEMKMERGMYDPALLSDDANFTQFRRQALDRLIQEALLLREAERAGVTLTAEEAAHAFPADDASTSGFKAALAERGIDVARWKEAQRRRLLIGKLIEQEVVGKIPVDDATVEAYYRKHQGDFRENTRFHARQILVGTREQADQIHAKLEQGEDFAKLAQEFSESPDGKRGGDLGFFDSESYPEVFSTICQQLAVGQTSAVTQTPYGYQIFQLLEKRPPRQRSLAEAKDDVRRLLQEQRAEEAFEPWLQTLEEKAKVSVDENTLKEVRLEG